MRASSAVSLTCQGTNLLILVGLPSEKISPTDLASQNAGRAKVGTHIPSTLKTRVDRGRGKNWARKNPI